MLATPAPLARPAALRKLLFLGFFGFLLVGLNCLVDEAALDITLLPRLLALLGFLMVSIVVVGMPRVSRILDWSILWEPVVLLFAGLLLVTCWSLVFAVNLTAGLTDVFRTLATLVTLGLSCLLLPIVPDWREHLLRLFVMAGLVGAAVGGSQLVATLGAGIHDRAALERITGLMSSVNLYAGMLALGLPWCLCGAAILRRGWRGLAAGAAVAMLAIIVVLQSRAAWLAVLAGAAAAVGLLVVRPGRFNLSRRGRRYVAGACLGGLAVLAGGIMVAPADNPLAQRFRSIFQAPAGPADLPHEGGRLMIWGITARMIADHPFTGVGAGNFTVRLPEYFTTDDLDFSAVHTNWLQPHNDFLWVFAEKGVPGILLFAGCFAAGLASIRTVLTGGENSPLRPPADRWLALASLMGLVSYGILSCFDFPLERITHQVSLAVLLAVVTVLARGGRPTAGGRPAPSGSRLWRWAATPLVLVALGLGIVYCRAAILQEQEVGLARRAWRAGRWDEMLAAARRARTPWKTLDPLATPVAFFEGMAHVQLGDVPAGIECLERAWHDNPNRMYVVNNLGILYASTGRFEEAIECFRQTAERYPHRTEPFNNLAGSLIEAGRPAEAVEILEQIPEPLRDEALRRNLAVARESAAAAAAVPAADATAEPAEPAP